MAPSVAGARSTAKKSAAAYRMNCDAGIRTTRGSVSHPARREKPAWRSAHSTSDCHAPTS